MTTQAPSKDLSRQRDWRAGCECNRVGLCFRCQAADAIERLELQVYALTNANKSLADAAAGQPPNSHTHEPRVDDAIDAERYRWLRANGFSVTVPQYTQEMAVWDDIADSLVDRARATATKGSE